MTKKSEKPKSAADLYVGTNKRLTIMIVLMSIWTVFLIVGSIILSVAAYRGVQELYAQGRELKAEVKDKSSVLYKEVLNDLKTEVSSELKSAVTESLNSAKNSTDETYNQLLKALN